MTRMSRDGCGTSVQSSQAWKQRYQRLWQHDSRQGQSRVMLVRACGLDEEMRSVALLTISS